MVGADGSVHALSAVRWAAREAAQHNPPLHLVPRRRFSPGNRARRGYAENYPQVRVRRVVAEAVADQPGSPWDQ
ncbi:universal stress protein [Nocardia mangyaensis]|uniref:universal stress protein n=1 Tax=Nocardia mangyaensis TaxID=2213200 RepID=UPI000A05DCE0